MTLAERVITLGYLVTILSFGACLLLIIAAIVLGSAPEHVGMLVWMAVGLVILNFAFKLAATVYFKLMERPHG